MADAFCSFAASVTVPPQPSYCIDWTKRDRLFVVVPGRALRQVHADLLRLEAECERLRGDVLDREAQLARRPVWEKTP